MLRLVVVLVVVLGVRGRERRRHLRHWWQVEAGKTVSEELLHEEHLMLVAYLLGGRVVGVGVVVGVAVGAVGFGLVVEGLGGSVELLLVVGWWWGWHVGEQAIHEREWQAHWVRGWG